MAEIFPTDEHVTRILADFVCASQPSDMTDQLRHEAKRALMNFFAVALVGSNDPTLEKAYVVLEEFAGNPVAGVIGRKQHLDILTAAFLNAAAANVFDFDDTHFPTIIHPTAPVAAALFALSSQQRISGIDFIHAFTLGVEAECRIGNAVSPFHYKRGWHITSTCGVFGSAVAVGKIIGLSPQQMLWALGSASAQAGGLVETLGYMAKSTSVGNTARNGLLAALLAARDFDGPPRALEGERGFLHVFGDAPDISAITQDLGSRWEALQNTYKPYPCGVVLNPVIEACLELYGQDVDAIEEIVVSGHSLLRERADRPNVVSGRESQVCAQHAVAVSLIFGKASVAQFSDTVVQDATVRALGARVRVVEETGIQIEGVRIDLHLKNGDKITKSIEAAKGCAANPLTDQDLEVKLRELAEGTEVNNVTEQLIDAIWSMEGTADMSRILNLAVPKN